MKRVKIALNDTPNTIDETWVFICDLHHKPWAGYEQMTYLLSMLMGLLDWDYGDFELSQNHKHLSFKTHRKGYFNINGQQMWQAFV